MNNLNKKNIAYTQCVTCQENNKVWEEAEGTRELAGWLAANLIGQWANASDLPKCKLIFHSTRGHNMQFIALRVQKEEEPGDQDQNNNGQLRFSP